jgi:hypothetical protein
MKFPDGLRHDVTGACDPIVAANGGTNTLDRTGPGDAIEEVATIKKARRRHGNNHHGRKPNG